MIDDDDYSHDDRAQKFILEFSKFTWIFRRKIHSLFHMWIVEFFYL